MISSTNKIVKGMKADSGNRRKLKKKPQSPCFFINGTGFSHVIPLKPPVKEVKHNSI
jgi:hypothetical protein